MGMRILGGLPVFPSCFFFNSKQVSDIRSLDDPHVDTLDFRNTHIWTICAMDHMCSVAGISVQGKCMNTSAAGHIIDCIEFV